MKGAIELDITRVRCYAYIHTYQRWLNWMQDDNSHNYTTIASNGLFWSRYYIFVFYFSWTFFTQKYATYFCDRVKNIIFKRFGLKECVDIKIDKGMLKWFGQMKRVNEVQWRKRYIESQRFQAVAHTVNFIISLTYTRVHTLNNNVIKLKR